jgi:hypothetical protein
MFKMFLPNKIFHILLSVSSGVNVFDKLLASVHTHMHARACTVAVPTIRKHKTSKTKNYIKLKIIKYNNVLKENLSM